MSRRCVVTGSASGIGRTTVELLAAAGHRVVGVDRRGADVTADLGTTEGRAAMVEGVRATLGDAVDAVVACAGLSGQSGDPDAIVRVNFFGAVATLAGLRPLLAAGRDPRAVTVASIALLREPDEALLAACRDEDEPRALAHRVEDGHLAYTSAKLALARWVRRQAPQDDWAGAGIALNAVAPGVIDTPMTTYLLGTEERRAETAELMPQPLGGFGAPEHVASLIAWLASAENGFVTGQVVFVDGGYEALTRGGRAWP